jgi:hypothetical protein
VRKPVTAQALAARIEAALEAARGIATADGRPGNQ